jgi:hypothetical protein
MSKESVEALLGKETVEYFRRLQVETEALAKYIADYVMEEQSRGNLEVDKYMIMDAISAYYKGGAR